MHADDDMNQPFFAWLERMKSRREANARLAAAREALNKVAATPSALHACCPVCNGAGTLAVTFGSKDDESL